MKLRLRLARLLDEVDNAIHLFLVCRAQTFESFAVIKQLRFGLLGHEIDHLGQGGLRGGEQLRVIARTAFVPIAKRFPFLAVCARAEDFAFGRENKIRVNRKFEIGQAGLEQIDRAPGVDSPDCAGLLELTN